MKIHLFLLTLVMALSYVYGGLASFTGVVVDADTGEPIENAKVRAVFSNRATKFFESGTSDSYWDFTDKEGRVFFSKWTTKGEVGWGIDKVKGYYREWGEKPKYTRQSMLSLGLCWLPLHQTVTARLDRIVAPIPLYVQTVRGDWYGRMEHNQIRTNKTSVSNTIVGSYDLVKGDWLPPHGNGIVEDMRFSIDAKCPGTELDRINLLAEFPGDGNGVCAVTVRRYATLKLRMAPIDGYVHSVTQREGWFCFDAKSRSEMTRERCFAFRIRTKKDENGSVTDAFYGKIYGDLNFLEPDFDGWPVVYYLNPTSSDRNLEFDRKTNLNRSEGERSRYYDP